MGLTTALLATIGVMAMDIENDGDDDKAVLAHVFGCCFTLSFLTSLTGMSLCVLCKVQFGFAADKESFLRRFGAWMDAPSKCLIGSGALVRHPTSPQPPSCLRAQLRLTQDGAPQLISGVCVRVHVLYEPAVAWVLSGIGIALFLSLLVLRVTMKKFNVAALDGMPSERRQGQGQGP